MPEITVNIDELQEKLLDGLIPFYGKDKVAVLKTIFNLWIAEHIADDNLIALQYIGAIKGFE